jgi:tripartite-type tricarboxylate transporter receptor subunit TctC
MKRTLIASTVLLMTAAPAFAWPDRPITMIVPWAAGGGTDAVARTIAAGLEQELGQPVNVVNRTGGGGVIGHNELVNAEADGYTIALATAELTTYYWAGTGEFTYEQVTPIALVNFDAGAFHVSANSEWDDLGEALQAIREEPAGTYKLSGMPAGAGYHLAFAGLLQQNDIEPNAVTVVPSQGAAPGFQALAAGTIEIVPSSLPEGRSMVDAGRVKALAVFANERVGAFPDVPTVEDAIGDAYAGGTWRGVVGPAGLPDEVVARLTEAVETVVQGEDYRQFMENGGFGTGWAKGDEFAQFLAEQHENNGEIMQAIGLRQRN